MDLIYADSKRMDVGVMKSYTLDLAYGSGENDFECSTELATPECQPGYYLYIYGTDYGGIIDGISVNTKENKLVYTGRTWHGILQSKVIEPDEGADYYYADGEANTVIADILKRADMGNVFAASSEDSGIRIKAYPLRYQNAYDGICSMLSQASAKLKIRWEDGNVVLSAILLTDYSLKEEFDSSQIQFSLKKQFNHVNHLICLGSGELLDRKIIHLFTDENGTVQPYLYDMDGQPLQDSDYILDKRNQLSFGKEEYTEVYDYNTAGTAENYKILNEKPDIWDESYDLFYQKEENAYKSLKRNLKDVYVLLTSQPSDWETFDNYYTLDTSSGEDVYKRISGDERDVYEVVVQKPENWNEDFSDYYKKVGNDYERLKESVSYTFLSSKPPDWETNYSDYYYTDGTDYYSVSGDTIEEWIVQIMQPSDWAKNWKDYYSLASGSYQQLEELYPTQDKAPAWQAGSYYGRGYTSVAPEFGSEELSVIYQKMTQIPSFDGQTVYKLTHIYDKEWKPDTFYEKVEDKDLGVEFIPGVYYEKVYDNYADLVSYALKRLEQLSNMDDLDIDLDENENTYDIGDIVGARENTTGIFVAKKVTKKIVKIEKGVVTIRHEVG